MAVTRVATKSPAAAVTSERRRNLWPVVALAAVISAFVILGTVIALKTPAYESADEPGHVQNIETLVSGHWYGMQASCQPSKTEAIPLSCSGDEAQQAPLYYLVMAGWQKLAGVPAHAPLRAQYNPAVYFGVGVPVFSHDSSADHQFLLWLRIPNVLLGALTVLFAFLSVRLVTTDRWSPVVAASLIAFLPRYVFLSSFVTNDNLVDLLGAVLVFLALRYANSPSGWRMAWVGVAFGLLITTKLSILSLGLAIVVMACLVPGWVKRLKLIGIGLGTALLLSSWYLIQNTVRYGDPLARAATVRYLTKTDGLGVIWSRAAVIAFLKSGARHVTAPVYAVADPLRHVLVSVPNRIVETFWYQSGWNFFSWPWPINLAITLAFSGAIFGLVGRHVRSRTLVTLGALSVAALLSVWVVSFQTGTYEARYAYVGLTAMCGLAALGLERWSVPVRFLLPLAGLVGTLVAIQQDVIAVHWT